MTIEIVLFLCVIVTFPLLFILPRHSNSGVNVNRRTPTF